MLISEQQSLRSMDIYFTAYHPECGETFLSLFPVSEQSIDIIVWAVAKLRLGNYNLRWLRIENGRHSTPKLPEQLKTKYTSSYLAIDMMQLENL